MWEFPRGPAVRTWRFHCRAPGSIHGLGTKIPRASHHNQKQNKNKNKSHVTLHAITWLAHVFYLGLHLFLEVKSKKLFSRILLFLYFSIISVFWIVAFTDLWPPNIWVIQYITWWTICWRLRFSVMLKQWLQ